MGDAIVTAGSSAGGAVLQEEASLGAFPHEHRDYRPSAIHFSIKRDRLDQPSCSKCADAMGF